VNEVNEVGRGCLLMSLYFVENDDKKRALVSAIMPTHGESKTEYQFPICSEIAISSLLEDHLIAEWMNG